MNGLSSRSLPFPLSNDQSFYESLNDWIGDLFYDILPEHGYEVRDEQIYMAFQLEKAFKDKKVLFAEAGVGTGKTIVYLLHSLAYARYTNKPVIIACADEHLIEQLVKKQGDLAKLESLLGLSIDVRLAKSRDQYLCLKKLEKEMDRNEDEYLDDVMIELPDFVYNQGSLTNFYPYGDRKDFPELNNEQWSTVNWDSMQNCMTCDLRHRCGLTLHRDHYRKSSDFIICSHDFYMEHVWSKESRVREGQQPLLPEAGAVIFDEGHLLEIASQKGLTYKISSKSIPALCDPLLDEELREETHVLMDSILQTNDHLFDLLEQGKVKIEGSSRLAVTHTADVHNLAKKLHDQIDYLSNELAFESEVLEIDPYQLKVAEETMEQVLYSLNLFNSQEEAVIWLLEKDDELQIVIMPELVEDILEEKVFSQKIPFVFSSATLSSNGNFNYIERSLGIKDSDSFTVASPFDYEEKMKIVSHSYQYVQTKIDRTIEAISNNEGSTLVLFTSKEEMDVFKSTLATHIDQTCTYYFEGEREMSSVIQEFQENKHSVLCSWSLWEGLDIPGNSLTQIVIYSLPFPPHDPVFDAKRKRAKDAMRDVDIPFMQLRLRQGIGRLIRTQEDSGVIHLMVSDDEQVFMSEIEPILPVQIENR
jgi:ATP-dependent DNA helicase DinG